MKNAIILLPTLYCLLLSACQGSMESMPTDLNLATQPSDAQLLAPTLLSTALYERDIAISSDGTELYFTRGTQDQSTRVLMQLRQTERGWQGPEVLPFSGRYNDIEPFLAPDGNSLFFASNRPLSEGKAPADYNIWKVEKTADGWAEPEALPAPINTDQDEFYPAVAANGNLYFTAIREGGIGSEDIFKSVFQEGQYLEPMPLDTNINSKTYEFNAYVSPKEDLLIFSSYGRPDGLGGGDLYFSRTDADGRWMPAQNLGPEINSTKLDYSPFVDLPRGNLYFSSNRSKTDTATIRTAAALEALANRAENGFGNVYHIKMPAALE